MLTNTTDKSRAAVVLLSGGQDSTTCLFWALKRFKTVHALGFYYGQKHSLELTQAKKIADLAGVEFTILNVNDLLEGSSLTDHGKDVNGTHDKDGGLPSSFTAGRNALFLTLAGAYGYERDAFDIVAGFCQTDYTGYPDCRRVFIDSMETTLTLSMMKTGEPNDFRIHTPLMYLSKAETWRLAVDLSDDQFNVVEIVTDLTLTDYNGDLTHNDWGMGREDNPASKLRAEGYREAVAKGWIRVKNRTNG